ncbi:MAG: DNA polymerase III subunit gamma/tau [Neisseriaceae bacterium]
MKHTVLARKWRPKKFSDLIGQSTTVTILKNIISTQKLHHAYLLTGTRGIGKTTIARIIAKALNCGNLTDNDPCCKCSSCLEIDNGRFVDVIEIDAASNTGVDNIREVIENAQYLPTQGKYKVYIIDEVHMLSKSAFNAMLKTLEEPPQHIIFILATTDPQKMPITVLSRCLQLKLRNLISQEISDYLTLVLNNEKVKFEKNALETIADMANGSMRDALSLTDQAIAFTNGNITYELINQMLGNTDSSVLYALIDTIIKLDGNKLVEIAKKIFNDGIDLENVLQNLSKLLCEISIIQLTGKANNEKLSRYANDIHVNNVQLYFEICNLGIEQIKIVNDKYSTFVMTLLRMLAFNIGTNPNKQILLNDANFNTFTNKFDNQIKNNHSLGDELQLEVTEKIDITNKIDVTEKLEITEELDISIQQIEQIYESNSNTATEKYNFTGDWVTLVEKIVPHLKHSVPFLENSEFVEYKDNTFYVKIDNRYKSSFTNHTLEEIIHGIRNIVNDNISFSYTFSDNVSDTLKEKITQNKKLEHEDAVNAINNDEKLSTIITTFSATITPGSIKSLKS